MGILLRTCKQCGKKRFALFFDDGICSACQEKNLRAEEAKRKETEAARAKETANSGPNYVFVDVETTGLSHKKDAIVQISAIRYSGSKAINKFCTYVNPGQPIPPSATRIHGITDSMVRKAPRIAEIQQKFLDFINGGILVGYNTPFDLKFLDSAFHGALDNVAYLDVLPLAREILNLPDYKLETVSSHIGFRPNAGFHNALADCEATAAVFFGIDLCKYANSPKVYRSPDFHRYSGGADHQQDKPSGFNAQAFVYWNDGESARINGDFDTAFLLFDKARAAGLSAPWLFEAYAKAYRKLKDYNKEIEILEEGIKVCGGNADYLIERKEKTIALMAAQQKKADELRRQEEKRAEREQRKRMQEEAKSQSTRHTARPVAQCSEDGTIIKTFDSISSASKEVGVSPKGIRDAATGRQVHSGGFRWKYVESDTLEDVVTDAVD